MKVLVVDVGGTNVKLSATGEQTVRKLATGPLFTPDQMIAGIQNLTSDWQYDVVSIGYPGPVVRGRIAADPHNLGPGWQGFDFEAAFKRPVKIINDAAMQALGGYAAGKMLFVGLGTGLGSAMIVEGLVLPLELAHLPYKKSTFEDYVGLRGLKRLGKKKWRRNVVEVIERLVAALLPDEVLLGGGNLKELKQLPPACRPGDNSNAIAGGFRLWEESRETTLAEHRAKS